MSPLARMRSAGDERQVSLYGVRFRYRVDSDESGGSVAVIEVEIPPLTLVKPHEHTREDEFTLVLEGKVGARLGDEVSQLGAGATLIKPRGIPHALWNPTRSVARIVEILTPAGFERYFEELAPVLAMQGNSKAYYELSERYGVRILDEWIPELEEKHGVKL